MNIEFFDTNVFIGRPMNGVFKPVVTATELISEMHRQKISKSIVWHIFQYEGSPMEGNKMLANQISPYDALYGSWTVLPPQTGEIIRENFFEEMKKNKIAGINMFPEWHAFLLNKITMGDFLSELSERKIPLFLTKGRACISWESLYALMKDFPDIVCVLCDIGIWGVDRYTWPLLEKFPNMYIETSLLSLEEGGLEAAVNKFGADRFVFGTGFPLRYQKAAILQLLHADISEEAKRKIAYGNFERIMKETKL